MRPLATFSYFIFLTAFSFFHSPRPSFLPVPPSSPSLLPPRSSFFPAQQHATRAAVYTALFPRLALS